MLTATSAPIRTHETSNSWSFTFANERFFVAAEASGSELKREIKSFLKLIEVAQQTPPFTPEQFRTFTRDVSQKIPLVACAAGLLTDTAFFAFATHGSVYVSRGERFGPIITGFGSASGELKPGDMLLLTGLALKRHVPENKLHQIFTAGDLTLIAKKLNEQIDTAKSNQAVAAVIVEVTEKIEAKIATPEFQEISKPTRIRSAFFTPGVFLNRVRQHARPLALIITGLITALFILVGYGITARNQARERKEVQQVLGIVSHKFEEGMALIDLNPIRARELLTEVKTELESELAKNPAAGLKTEITSYLERVEQGMVTVSRQYEVSLNSFFALDLVSPAAEGKHMALYQDALVVLDTQHSALYRVSIGNKAAKVIAAGSDLANVTAVAVHGEDVFVLSDTIRKVALAQAQAPVLITKSDEWQTTDDMKVFAGNIYLLDRGRNWIWKYARTEEGYGSLQDYFVFDTLVDLQGADNLTIDGAVWVTQNGNILKFVQGQEVRWQITGLEQPLGSRLDIYTDDTTKNIYIFDADNQRVIVADKDGVYLSQYAWKEKIEITDFVVSEVIKKILLLSRGTIYGIDLK